MKYERPFHLLNEIHFLNEKGRPQRLDAIFIFFRLRTKIAELRPQKHQGPLQKFKKTHRREVRSTAACNLRGHATTVHFLAAIDRKSVLPPIFRGLCDVWSTLKSATFVTDECNVSSLEPAERLKKLVAVRIRCVSVRRMHSYMYPWSCAPSHVSSDMYVKDAVLCRGRQWEVWSTSVK
jgi:hypothetical protein